KESGEQNAGEEVADNSRRGARFVRRRRARFVASCLVLLSCLTVSAAPDNEKPLPAAFRGDRLLVKPKADVAVNRLRPLHAKLGAHVLRTFPGIGNLQVVGLRQGTDIDATIAAYLQSGLVEYAERDYGVEPLATPNDFRYWDGSLWALHNTGQLGGTPGADIKAPAGWDIQNTASNIIV